MKEKGFLQIICSLCLEFFTQDKVQVNGKAAANPQYRLMVCVLWERYDANKHPAE